MKDFPEWFEDQVVDEPSVPVPLPEWQEVLPGLVVFFADGIEPYQMEGLYHGFPFYLRERGGIFSLAIGEEEGTPFGESVLYKAKLATADLVSQLPHIDEKDPKLHHKARIMEIFKVLIARLEIAPYPYLFAGKEFPPRNNLFVASREDSAYFGDGHNPEEAYSHALSIIKANIDLLSDDKATKEIVLSSIRLKPEPLNQDTRCWPEQFPFH